nr:uncharacterized protein LOC124807562 [Hydra vulgaris]
MVNKCVVTNCKTGYSTGPKKSTFHFPEESNLRERCIYFVNRKDWFPSKYSAICIDHFEDKFIKYGKRCIMKCSYFQQNSKKIFIAKYQEIPLLFTEILECQLSEDNMEVAVTIAEGGPICPSQSVSDFICHLFSILDVISPILTKHCSYSFSTEKNLVLTLLLIGVSLILIWSLIKGKRTVFSTDSVAAIFNDKSGTISVAYSNTILTNLTNRTGNLINKNNNNKYVNNQYLLLNYSGISNLSTNKTNMNKSLIINLPPSTFRKVNNVQTCSLKKCSANKLFYDMAINVITDQTQLSTISQLKCNMGYLAASEEKLLSSNSSNCFYTSSESFLSPPYLEKVEKIHDALNIHLGILNEILSSLFLMSNNESQDARVNYFNDILSVQKILKSLMQKINNVLTELSTCGCLSLDDRSSKVYTQSYQQLVSKYSHAKSSFITLKQLEIMYKTMKRDFWERQKYFILAC